MAQENNTAREQTVLEKLSQDALNQARRERKMIQDTCIAELPGYKKEEVQAALHKGYLTISAAKSAEETVEGKYLRRERYTGSCQRSFYVGEYLRQEDIRASFQNGILTLFVPKEDKTKTEEKKYITIA